MTAIEELAHLRRQVDERHALALAENARLKNEVAALRGITLTQREVDGIINLLPLELHAEYHQRKELDHMRVACGRVL